MNRMNRWMASALTLGCVSCLLASACAVATGASDETGGQDALGGNTAAGTSASATAAAAAPVDGGLAAAPGHVRNFGHYVFGPK